MKVYGYKDNKDVVYLDLPIEEIVAREIDPWRLDLCDPYPVVFDDGDTRINFRRLDDVCFAYAKDRGFIFGMRDGTQSICVKSRDSFGSFNGDVQSVRLYNPEPSKLPFAQHWLEYLTVLSQEAATSPRKSFFAEMKVFQPQPAQRAEMRSNTVGFISPDDKALTANPMTFVGEMLAEQSIPGASLPEEIRWVFQEHGNLKPIVLGCCLRDMLLGKPISLVEFLVPFDSPGEMALLEKQLPPHSVRTWTNSMLRNFRRFEGKGCVYGFDFLRRLNKVSNWLASENYRFSSDHLYSVRSDEIRGSRIAIYDVCRGQTRPVSSEAIKAAYKDTVSEALIRQIAGEDLKLLLPTKICL
jgi:hypothetical protein